MKNAILVIRVKTNGRLFSYYTEYPVWFDKDGLNFTELETEKIVSIPMDLVTYICPLLTDKESALVS